MNLKEPHILIATWGGLGLMKKAPGTWGSLGGLVCGMLIMGLGGTAALVQAIFILGVAGCWATDKISKETETEDNQIIVVDEVVGQWIAMLAAGYSIPLTILSFALFRFFDIAKIWPADWCEKNLPNTYAVMLDDVVAGFYAFFFLIGLRYAGLG